MIKPLLFLADKIKPYLPADDTFTRVMQLKGKIYRDVPGRKTIKINLGSDSYFVKQHFGVGWKEIVKNLVSLKKPIISARTEKIAIEKLNTIGIATTPLVGFGEQGSNPARRQSFVITEDLGDIVSLEDLCAKWRTNPPSLAFKRSLIIAVAALAGKLHAHGLNHRDFYLCHLCLDAALVENDQKNPIYKVALPTKLYLIDLHRMVIHRQPHYKSNMKDIAALYFSAKDIGLTLRDCLRFRHHYGLYAVPQDALFWQKVMVRADQLYDRFHSAKFQKKLANEKARIDQ